MSNYGMCENCGAELVKNPKTGKIFCSEKCWLKNQPQPTFVNQAGNLKVKTEPDWDKINEKKTDNIKWLNAKTNATAIVVALIAKSANEATSINSESAKVVIRNLTQFFYDLEPEDKAETLE